jgi:hypothetical protein
MGSSTTNLHYLTCGDRHESLPHGVLQNKVENFQTTYIIGFQKFQMKWEETKNYNPIGAQF